ncbi:MAG: copper resistance protein CopC [Ktedonobacteraceae bacterium]|nr:copper resistance protein CopC [Ktedonobacteraceae bacterium]MBV9020224.1 copper resistance protein CopC [Ktedonobacteraceae bacterium]
MNTISRLNSSFYLFFAALLLALCLLLAFPTTGEAHAILLRSNPPKDAILNAAPDQVQMWFSEDLNPTFSTAVVVNASNQRVDAGDAHVAAGDTKEMDLHLRPNLPPAVYIVIWRTQSADDGHVLRGSFIFSTDGTAPKLSGALPGQDALGGGGTSAGSSSGQLDGPTLFTLIMTTLVDLGVVFWVGAQLWSTFVLQLMETNDSEQYELYQRVEQRFERLFSLPTLLLILLANVGVLLGQGLSITGNRFDQLFNPTLLVGLATNGRFGTYWLMREIVVLLAILLSAYMLYARRRERHTSLIDMLFPWVNLILGLALLIAVTLSGHAAAVSANILVYAVLSDWLHLLAASLWIGGMFYVALIYLPILKQRSALEQTRSLLDVLPRYSPLAIVGVVIMAITGPFNATVHMYSWQQLLTTAYGRTLDIKVLLIGALLITSAIHVGLLRPRLAKAYARYRTESVVEATKTTAQSASSTGITSPAETKLLEGRILHQTKRLSTILRWEPVLGVAVLLCTGLLTVFAGTLQPTALQQPQQAQQVTTATKPFTTTVKTQDGKFTVTLNVNPNHLGSNVFTATVRDSKGAIDTNVGVSLYTTMLDMDMGTDSINLQPDGKGHFSASGDLSMSGDWQIRIEIRTPDNTLHEVNVRFFTPF